MANRVGRPRTIESPDEFIEMANAYFDRCDTEGEGYSICGLALGLGLASRRSLYDYRDRPEYSPIVKRAMLIVEGRYERAMMDKSVTAAGPIFALKNMGWSDAQRVEVVDAAEHARQIREYLNEADELTIGAS